MIEIELTREKYAIIDNFSQELIDKIRSRSWHAHIVRKKIYAMDSNGRLMHRLIFNELEGFDPIEIDHIDGNGLNNRISNLRNCTKSQNMMNSNRKIGESGARGVRCVGIKKFRASIGINGKSIFLGVFESLKEASLAYDNAAIEYHGEFARPNRL